MSSQRWALYTLDAKSKMPMVMAEDEERPNTEQHARSMVESPLLSAARHLERSARPSESGDGGRPDFSSSFKALLEWGEERGLIRPESDFPFLRRSPDGLGDEHEAWFDEPTNSWFKATYPNKFGLGWSGGDSATPLEYLNRLLLQNKYFGDKVELVALVNCDGKMRVLTSQPHVAGEPASYPEIQRWLSGLGFKRIAASGSVAWYHEDENLLVADAHEGNVLRSGGNLLLPIDLNLMHPEGETKKWAQLEAAKSE